MIAGESYGGVYVPMLAQKVLDGNDAGATPRLNLKARRPWSLAWSRTGHFLRRTAMTP